MGVNKKAIKSMFQRNKWKILRGDKVVITAGKDKGETGIVSRVIRDDKIPRVIVEGRNLVSTHLATSVQAPRCWTMNSETLTCPLQNKRAIKRTEDNPGGLISVEVGPLLVHAVHCCQQGETGATTTSLCPTVTLALLQRYAGGPGHRQACASGVALPGGWHQGRQGIRALACCCSRH